MNQIIIASVLLTLALTVMGRPGETGSFSETTESLKNDEGTDSSEVGSDLKATDGIFTGCINVKASYCENLYCGRIGSCPISISSPGYTSKTRVKHGSFIACCSDEDCRICVN